ncbi:polycomb protein Su(z)12-like [Contarinia nasturtii]|uniref:polycomb protein Su(z)12-like n=1 Tax=Contarinia nasturtii TaxID=265458 RepID=UPI0012D3DA50|nr:polycomb protein Su(z)12-like [Contarinia nasturtii]
MDVDNADEEQKLFIQAFAEPTEAYRFYEEHRKKNPPLFLQRSLTYVNQKKCRSKKPRRRSSVKFNTLHAIADKLAEQKRGTKHYMTLTFSGFHCNELANFRHAEVLVFHKETKNKLTSVIVDINPIDMLKGLSTISLPTESLKITTPNGELLNITTCVLLFKVRVIDKPLQTGYGNRDEMPIENYVFESELELFDKSQNGLIASGQHDLSFAYESNGGLMSLPKQAMWKIKHFVKKSLSMNAIEDDDINKEFLKPAKMMCNLQWSREISLNNENKENGEYVNGSNGGGGKRRVLTRSRSTGSIMSRRFSTYKSNENIQCLVYQFIHKNYRQKTELWDRTKCPWCSLKTSNMYVLLKHLTLCHGRFKFKYVPGTGELRIDVFVNKRDDELKFDPFSRLGTSYRGKEPHKRKIMTAILVNRPERIRPRMSEFLNFDTVQKRTYYHSYSGLALKPSEIDVDSETETDPIWLQKNTVKMINDFLDVNDGEKGIMKLWNLFILKHTFVSDSQIPAAVITFIETYGESIIKNHLYRNCIIHLSNLFDYGLISAKDHLKASRKLHAVLIRNRTLCDILKEQIDQQCEHTRSQRLANVGKPPSKHKRAVLRVESTIKKRLRSQTRSEPIQNKIKRIDVIKREMPTTSTPRPVRKMARNSML